jgi:hypothetical protein
MSRKLLAISLLPLLAACVAQTAPPASAGNGQTTARAVRVPPTRGTPPPGTGFRPPPTMNLPGLEGVIGADRNGLQRQFGQPRLDVWEGDARKLQFSSQACVLDIYLYPPRPGAEPTAAYVDARRPSDGLDVDRAACVRALKR